MPGAGNMEVDGPEETENSKLKSVTGFCQQAQSMGRSKKMRK